MICVSISAKIDNRLVNDCPISDIVASVKAIYHTNDMKLLIGELATWSDFLKIRIETGLCQTVFVFHLHSLFQISSNPIGSDGALVLVLAMDRNDSSCLNYLELQVSEFWQFSKG